LPNFLNGIDAICILRAIKHRLILPVKPGKEGSTATGLIFLVLRFLFSQISFPKENVCRFCLRVDLARSISGRRICYRAEKVRPILSIYTQEDVPCENGSIYLRSLDFSVAVLIVQLLCGFVPIHYFLEFVHVILKRIFEIA